MDSEKPVPILIVDDHPANLVVLEAVLGDLKCCEIIKAGSGREALSHLLKRDFAVILLDIQMPEMDGFETAELIRSREKSRFTPIIFVTAVYSESRFIQRGYEAGAVDYITKPYDAQILRSKVSVFAELYRKNRMLQEQAEIIATERTERVRVEARQEHYRSIMNGLDHSIIWEAGIDLRFLFVSRRAETLLGFPHDRWFSEPGFFLSRIPEEDRGLVERAIRESVSTGADQRCDHRMLNAAGETLWFHTGLQFERKAGSDQATLQGLTVDITSLKTSELELRKSEAKYRRVIDANMLGHFFADLKDGCITQANDCFLEMVGYTREELLDGKVSWARMTPPEHAHLDQSGILELASTGVCTPFEKEYIRKDGSRVPALIGAARMDDEMKECVCFALDLTERKKSEHEKTKAVRAREEMLEIVSHDLRGPLSAILLNAQIVLRKVASEGGLGFVSSNIEIIERSAERMKRLIEDLLDLAKVDSGRLVITKDAYSPEALLNDVLELVRPMTLEKNVRIETEFPSFLPEIPVDRDRMAQVLMNLLGNALKFSPENGKVRVSIEHVPGETRFVVSDAGPGIPSEDLERIFNRYWQAKEGERQGTGLGLAIAKGIVEAHGGRIWALSEVGKGSTFVVSIPAGA